MFPVAPIPTPRSTFLLSHRPDLDIIFLRWLRPYTLAEAQLSYRDSLALALEHNCSNWLPLATLEAAIERADQVRGAALQAAIATQQLLELDFRVQWADGSVHHASMAGRATTNEQGHSTGFTGVLRDSTAQRAVQDELNYKSLVLRLLAAIPDTQETERKRIAEALHNGLGQLLYATKLSLDGPDGLPPKPRATLLLLEDAIKATRTISFELTPGILEDFGLRTALEALVKRIAPARLPLPLHLPLTGLEQRLAAPVEIGVYRTVQELLNNVMKHARATEVEVHVAHEQGRLIVSVEDNGCGCDPAAPADEPLAGIGLVGARNRVALLGGELAIQAQPGRGTIVSFELELSPHSF